MQRADSKSAILFILSALLLCASFLVWKKSRVIADYHYSQCWTYYYMQNRLEHGQDSGDRDARLLRLAEACRKDLYQELDTGTLKYPNHPSLEQLIYLIDKDSKTYGFVLPAWVRDKASTLDAGKVMERDRYLTKNLR